MTTSTVKIINTLIQTSFDTLDALAFDLAEETPVCSLWCASADADADDAADKRHLVQQQNRQSSDDSCSRSTRQFFWTKHEFSALTVVTIVTTVVDDQYSVIP